MTGCLAPQGNAPSGTASAPGGTTAAVSAPMIPVEGDGAGPVEVQAFKGGYGIDFYQKAAEEFSAKNPKMPVTVDGDPRVWEKLRPRLTAGTPPDLMFPGWGMDAWGLVGDGALYQLDAALDTPAADGKTPWRETFDPKLLALGQQDGKTFMLPYYFNMNGWWYDKAVFDANGWTPPKTYDELLVLCEKIKAKGIAPLTYQGKYPYYMIWGMLLPWAYSEGGADVVRRIQNLEPGAWNDPAVKRAAERIVELRDKGYFLEGSTALDHTESQTQFVLGKAAMIPCGTWLESEMRKNLTPQNQLTFFLPPVIAGGKGDPSAIMVSVEPWMVAKDAKNPVGAMAYYKYLTSVEKASQFVREKSTLTAIKGSEETDLPNSLKEPVRFFRESKEVYAWQLRDWYKDMHTELENALTALLNKDQTVEQFLARCEAAAEKTRNNAAIRKHTAQ